MNFSTRLGTILAVELAFALICMLQSTPAASAFSEETIGAAVSAHRPTTKPVSKSAGQLRNDVTPPDSEPHASAPLAPRASFPYTIRPGDTLGMIAAEFGITVPDLAHANRLSEETELVVGNTLRIPNPSLARERELSAQIDRLSADLQEAQSKAQSAADQTAAARDQVHTLTASNRAMAHDARMLVWWRAAGYTAAAAALLMLGVTLLVLVEWLVLRNRFRAVAELNESLRRLDYKYRSALAKAELRLQELYGRRKRGLTGHQERPRLPEEAEIEALTHDLKAILEGYVEKLGRAGAAAHRARWRERASRIGSPIEARGLRR